MGDTTCRHPAKPYYLAAAILLLLTVVLSFITVFIPWSWKDIAPGLRIWAYPFKNCVEETNSPLNAESCQDNDYTADNSVSGGNRACRGFIIATIVFVFVTVITGVISLIVWALFYSRLWCKPYLLAPLFQCGLLVVWMAALLAWIMWISYAETMCAEGSVLFPLRGYSYGFTCHIFASATAFLALVTGGIGLWKVFRFNPLLSGDYFEPFHGEEMAHISPNPIESVPRAIPVSYWQAVPASPCGQVPGVPQYLPYVPGQQPWGASRAATPLAQPSRQ